MDATSQSQTYLITGGAGFLGINLVRHLVSKGNNVVSYDIAPFDYPDINDEKVTAITGDICNYKDVLQAMNGIDVVVHAAAALPLYTPEEIRQVNLEGTENVINAAKEAGITRVVHISSTAVYGIPDHHPLYEHDALQGVGPYGETKVAAEHFCEEMRAQGMCIPIIRPKSFIGPERLGVFALLYDWAKDGKNFPILGNGKNLYQLLDVEDLCEAIYLVSTLDSTVANDTFNIGAKEFGTMKDDFQAVLDQAGFGKKVIAFPAGPVIFILKILEKFHLSPLYKWVYETAATDSFVSIEKAEKILNFTPKHSNKDALLRNYSWYLEHMKEFERASGVSHRVPWKQGALGIIKAIF